MPTITIEKLNPVGAELFNDSESYLSDLTEEELSSSGGATPTITTIPITMSIAASGLSFLASHITGWSKYCHR
ncbi:MAG: hypothetical protein SVX43_01585 [Cyanobacteriota bacterium]|nr:hypothetical protein [Cyanobacteriota bacterium]